MLRVGQRVGSTAAQEEKECRKPYNLEDLLLHVKGKIIGASVLFVGGGIGGTISDANYGPCFRENIEETIPYSINLFEMVLGPLPSNISAPKKPMQPAPLKISSAAKVMKESEQPAARSVKSKTDLKKSFSH